MATLCQIGNFFCILSVACLIVSTSAKPGYFQEFGSEQDKCRQGDDYFLEVCQRCAIQTKSPVVYPMCCRSEDDVFGWCLQYISYGKNGYKQIDRKH